MRRLLVVLALLALMVGVQSLQAAPSAGARDPLTLATIGFVLLAAFTLAESGAALRLPRVTGYIVGGALLGPSASNLLNASVVDEMRMFNTLALGLIATSAGLELDARQVAKVWRTLVATIAFKIAFFSVLVGGGLVLFERLYPSLDLPSRDHVYALALVFAALAIGTSPAITLALLSELRAKGRPADLFLGAAVLKDLVVVIALAVAVALARPLLGEHATGHGGLAAVGVELGGSLLAGLILGGLLVAYIRFVHAEMLLFVAAMILVVSELSLVLHLELLLVFIAAGFVVRNFSKYEHELMRPVSLVALPVFVVFFTNAGASIDIARTLHLLPIAVTLCALRALGLWGAAGLGARVGREADAIRRHSWLGYIPQAGVTLGLVGVTAAQLPPLAETIAGLGMAVVAVNLLIGPLTLRVALTKLGAQLAPADPEPGQARLTLQSPVAPEAYAPLVHESLETQLPGWRRELGNAELSGAIHSLCRDTLDVGAAHCRALQRAKEGWAGPLSQALSAGRTERALQSAERLVAEVDWLPMHELGDLTRTAFRHLCDRVRALPAVVLDPLDRAWLRARRGDSLWVELARWQRRAAMVFSQRARMRRIPLQLLARAALEQRLAEWAAQQLVDYARLRASLSDVLERYLRDQSSSSEAMAEVSQLLDGWPVHVEREWIRAVQTGIAELVSTCVESDLPGQDLRRVRLSRHVRRITDHLAALERDPPLWQRALEVRERELLLEFQLAAASVAFCNSVSNLASEPAERALTRLDQVLTGVARELKQLAIRPTAGATAGIADWRNYKDREHLDRLEEEAAGLRAASALQQLRSELRGIIARLPERVECLRTPLEPQHLAAPASLRFRVLAPRAMASEQLVDRLLPRLEEHLESVAAGMDAALETLHGIDAMTGHALEQGETAVFERAAQQAVSARARLNALQQSTPEVQRDVQQAFSALASRLSPQADSSLSRTATPLPSRWVDVVGQFTAGFWVRWTRSMEGAVRTVSRFGDFELAQRYRERLARGALDGATMARSVETFRALPQLPPDYAKLFAIQPVREPRLFSARQPELRAVLEAESGSWRGMPSSVLIVGAHGSGRTSVLNLAQLELRSPRVLRPQPGLAQRRGELLRALGNELDCPPDAHSLSKVLLQIPTTILVDDLEHWFEPNLVGIARLDEFVQLVSATREAVCFIVVVSNGAFQIFRELVPLQAAFPRHVQLTPLRTADLRRVIEARHRLSGMPLVFHSELGLRWLRRLGSDREATLFFQLLRRMTNGNLSFALGVFLSSLELADGHVRARTEHPLSVGLSFLDELDTQQLAALNQALRFGGVDESSLEGATEMPSEAKIQLAFLQATGLLVPEGPRRRLLSIPAELRPIVEQALAQRGAGTGGNA